MSEYKRIAPDPRGHGRSTNPARTIPHRQCALDILALLEHLGLQRCRAIGISMGGNILLHMATLQPERIEAMVVVSATTYFPEQAREYAADFGGECAAERMGNDAVAA
jgi:pimeloyl-ACP methyl ester carboxylesterase